LICWSRASQRGEIIPEWWATSSGISSLGKALGLTTIAEGEETTEQETLLREHNCDEMQGFLCSKAVPADDIAGLFQASCRAAPNLQPFESSETKPISTKIRTVSSARS